MKHYSKLIVILFTSLMTLGIIVFIIWPNFKNIKQLNNDIYNQRVALEKLYLRGQNIKKTREDYEKISDKIKILDNVFNQSGQELKFITSLEQAAQEQDIDQNIELDNNEDKDKNGYQTLKVKLKLSGTFPRMLSYLDQIQTMDYYFNIDYLKFYNSQDGTFQRPDRFFQADKIDEQEKEFIKSDISQEIEAEIRGVSYWK